MDRANNPRGLEQPRDPPDEKPLDDCKVCGRSESFDGYDCSGCMEDRDLLKKLNWASELVLPEKVKAIVEQAAEFVETTLENRPAKRQP